jgi:hypothetical protein
MAPRDSLPVARTAGRRRTTQAGAFGHAHSGQGSSSAEGETSSLVRGLLLGTGMTLNRQSPAAAPPDDGGHQGSYTTPDQTMEAHAADRPDQAPALNRDLDRSTPARGGVSPGSIIAVTLLFVAITAFFIFIH